MSRVCQSSLKIEVQKQGSSAVVRLYGSAGIYDDVKLRRSLEKLAEEKVHITVLDLTDLDFIESAGLAAIVSGHLKNRHHQGEIRLAAPNAAVLEVIQKTRLDTLFPIYGSVEEALVS